MDPEKAKFYQSQVGVIWWMIELGRVNVIIEASILVSQISLTCCGHMNALLHLFGYLINRHNMRMTFNSM